jgi:hypothetical protein
MLKLDKVPGTNATNLRLNSKHEARNPKQIQNSNVQNSKQKKFDALEVVFVLVI